MGLKELERTHQPQVLECGLGKKKKEPGFDDLRERCRLGIQPDFTVSQKSEEKVERRACAYRECCCCGIVLLSLGLPQGPGKVFGRSEKVVDGEMTRGALG